MTHKDAGRDEPLGPVYHLPVVDGSLREKAAERLADRLFTSVAPLLGIAAPADEVSGVKAGLADATTFSVRRTTHTR